MIGDCVICHRTAINGNPVWSADTTSPLGRVTGAGGRLVHVCTECQTGQDLPVLDPSEVPS